MLPLSTVSIRNPWCPGVKTSILQEDGSERKFCENKIQEEKCDKNTKKSCNHYKFCRLHIKVRTKNVVLLYFRQASPQVASKIYHSFRENFNYFPLPFRQYSLLARASFGYERYCTEGKDCCRSEVPVSKCIIMV